MQPKLIRRGTGEHTSEGLVRVKLPGTDGEYALDPLAGLVWTLSDGSRTLEAVSAAAAEALKRRITREEVFLALDFLADAGLMERVAPPAAEVDLARRALLARIATPALGAAAAAAIAIGPRSAKADESSYKEDRSKENSSKTQDEGRRELRSKREDTDRKIQELGNTPPNRSSSDESFQKTMESKEKTIESLKKDNESRD